MKFGKTLAFEISLLWLVIKLWLILGPQVMITRMIINEPWGYNFKLIFGLITFFTMLTLTRDLGKTFIEPIKKFLKPINSWNEILYKADNMIELETSNVIRQKKEEHSS